MRVIFLSFGNLVIFNPLCYFFGVGSDLGKLKTIPSRMYEHKDMEPYDQPPT